MGAPGGGCTRCKGPHVGEQGGVAVTEEPVHGAVSVWLRVIDPRWVHEVLGVGCGQDRLAGVLVRTLALT